MALSVLVPFFAFWANTLYFYAVSAPFRPFVVFSKKCYPLGFLLKEIILQQEVSSPPHFRMHTFICKIDKIGKIGKINKIGKSSNIVPDHLYNLDCLEEVRG